VSQLAAGVVVVVEVVAEVESALAGPVSVVGAKKTSGAS
jgi:hypothetical protein